MLCGSHERLALIVEAEVVARESKRLKKLVTDAKLRFTQACVEDIDYPAHLQELRELVPDSGIELGHRVDEHLVITRCCGEEVVRLLDRRRRPEARRRSDAVEPNGSPEVSRDVWSSQMARRQVS